ncbi:MAG: hypothetical protein J6C93_01610 [Clostridia bacterium]|nr:hypothetical protein [Clostridia bacterium]
MNDLIITSAALQEYGKNGLSSILKPFIKEIYLTELSVYHISDYCAPSQFLRLREGDKLLLKHEKTPYNGRNVNVYTKDAIKVGKIGEFDEEIICNLLDGGKTLKTVIKSANYMLEIPVLIISVSLVDI